MNYTPFSAKIRLPRLVYYWKSLCCLWRQMLPAKRGAFLFAALFFRRVKTIYLARPALVFRMRTLLDVLTLKEVVIDREYEQIGVSLTKKDTVIVDIGAGFGDFSILMAKRNPNAVLYAFEPDGKYFHLLKENIALNQVTNVHPIHASVHSIRDVFAIVSEHVIDVIKVDCEGEEFAIFSDHRAFKKKSVYIVVMEYHEHDTHSADTIKTFFTDAGYTVQIQPRQHMTHIGLLSAKKRVG